MSLLNIEIKAKSNNHAFLKKTLLENKAIFKGTDHQIDTYFNVKFGRLKLREGKIENFLIQYERENKKGPKQSNLILYQTQPHSTLKQALIKATGILIVVDKKREIYFIDNVKFHIDKVKNLGTFMEIEAIDRTGSIGHKKLLEQCKKYMKLLQISENDLISVSYSDLLLDIK